MPDEAFDQQIESLYVRVFCKKDNRMKARLIMVIDFRVTRISSATAQRNLAKDLLAAIVKKYYAVSKEWIAKPLEMRHPAVMSMTYESTKRAKRKSN